MAVALVRAQFDAQIGQYMLMPASYNPAAVGDGDLMRVYASHRMDFTGIQDAPMTTYFSFSSPFVIGKSHHGVGVRFMNDRFGLFTNQSLYLGYAYKFRIGKGRLAIGVDAGFLNLSFASDSVDTGAGNDEYHDEHDPAIPNAAGGASEKGVSGMGFDMNIGVYYTTSKWWAGVSYAHVMQPTLEWGSENTEISVNGTMYIAGGYNWQLKNKDWMLLPSMMVQTDFRSWDVNLTMLAQLKKRYRFGLGYRLAGSVNVLLGMDIVNGLQIGYTYELPANALLKESYGSHEVYLAYGFNVLKPKNTNKCKSVRYL
ncbi:MAG: PorP/SprF family type IX secretion system membrane protein [Paludibacteraceae bacterium]|jgi:type IX secretion system PorP/SprF family membrane protein|nr:PorP/SprF family type IX secretion system membrane protein [Paludibacteraceae bacterium]